VWRSKARQKRSLMMLLSCSCCGILLNAARRSGGGMHGRRKRKEGKREAERTGCFCNNLFQCLYRANDKDSKQWCVGWTDLDTRYKAPDGSKGKTRVMRLCTGPYLPPKRGARFLPSAGGAATSSSSLAFLAVGTSIPALPGTSSSVTLLLKKFVIDICPGLSPTQICTRTSNRCNFSKRDIPLPGR